MPCYEYFNSTVEYFNMTATGDVSVNRRTFVTIVGGTVTALAGCSNDDSGGSGGGNSDGGNGDTDSAETDESPESGDTSATSGSENERVCAEFDAPFVTYTPDPPKLPLEFDYPEPFGDEIGYLAPDRPEDNTVQAYINKGGNQLTGGDVEFVIGMDLFDQGGETAAENWYGDRSQRTTIATADVNGESVDFIFANPGEASYDERYNGYSAAGIVPYEWADEERPYVGTTYHRVGMSCNVYLGDEETIDESCAETLRDAVETAAGSISVMSGVPEFEEVAREENNIR